MTVLIGDGTPKSEELPAGRRDLCADVLVYGAAGDCPRGRKEHAGPEGDDPWLRAQGFRPPLPSPQSRVDGRDY